MLAVAFEQPVDERAAALRKQPKFAGVVQMFGAKNTGKIQEVAIEAERSQKIAGIVGEARAFGNGQNGTGRV
jgi:hypothetical protein